MILKTGKYFYLEIKLPVLEHMSKTIFSTDVLLCFLLPVINTSIKSNLGRRKLNFVGYRPSLRKVRAGTQDRNLELGADAETSKE